MQMAPRCTSPSLHRHPFVPLYPMQIKCLTGHRHSISAARLRFCRPLLRLIKLLPMASILRNCTEAANSTDCLLQALITILEESQKNDSSYNWDPITFAFTVTISLFAAIFASITILQAILVAGPGRRKSDHRAIGRWANQRERKWSWRDFSFIHIAHTPVFTLRRLPRAVHSRQVSMQVQHLNTAISTESSSRTKVLSRALTQTPRPLHGFNSCAR